ncbi:GNAT family N-acetyltransferase [Psychroserpens sp. Hel_I_66]|uniref:GNAT family N-acetyltransferase n=1 Tax=Psychroserpens sp. Hel_I_66 TaxID=1250004 RepID=UPI0009DDA0CD|nr:GNAT family N-acetyltransferase [Psychroserpens sp. Hel_I_66]
MIKNDSIIDMALQENQAIGFVQLYHFYSSVSMKSMYLLNDLFVNSKHHNKGIDETLVNRVKNSCKSLNNKGLSIQTAFNNPTQQLCEL